MQLVDRKDLGNDTFELTFTRSKDFNFTAGQYIKLRIPVDEELLPSSEAFRVFSLASSPQNNEQVKLAVRVSVTPYRYFLTTLPIGEEFIFTEPEGTFTIQDKSPLIFIAGGIGIAPFLSMLYELSEKSSKQQVTIFYTNSSYERAVYLPTLKQLEKQNPHLKVFSKVGRISWKEINDSVLFTPSHMWYIAGPPEMTRDLRFLLQNQGIESSKILTEAFTSTMGKKDCANPNCQCACA